MWKLETGNREPGITMRILITGITGFVGGHLVEFLRAEGGHELFGISRKGTWPTELAHLSGSAQLFTAELLDTNAIAAAIRAAQPEWVFHLAGFAHAGKSFQEPDRCWNDNLTGTRVLYDTIARSAFRPRILFVSSGLIYGDLDNPSVACDEQTPLKPASPYAASKAAADLLSYQTTRSPGLDVIRVRMFNQIGPRQPADYALANFARQIAAIEAGHQPPILNTGDLSAERDVTDVRDMVSAFRRVIDLAPTGEVYNAGRGQTFTIRELLERLVQLARVPVQIQSATHPGRKADTAFVRADTTKLRTLTGWEPRYDLDQSLTDVLDYWRGVAARS